MAIREKSDALFLKYGIASFQVFWMGGKSNYIPETKELLEFYWAMTEIPQNSVIFHDRGNAFFSDGESVIESIFGCRTAVYPPLIHHFLSPNDNNFHGAGKAKWRSMAAENGWGKDDSVESSLALLSIFSNFDREAICSYFTKNFFIGRASIKPDRCMDLVTDGIMKKIRKSEFYQRSVSAYQIHLERKARNGSPIYLPPPSSLKDSLDGQYWEKN